MSHFSVLVIVPEDVVNSPKGISDYVDEILEPYNENLEVAPYITRYKENMGEYRAEKIAEYESKLAMSDAERYYNVSFLKERLAELKAMSDEQFWAEDTEGCKFDCFGNVVSTYNKSSKWDWYEIGGRFKNLITAKDGQQFDYLIMSEYDHRKAVEISIAQHEEAWGEAEKQDPAIRGLFYNIDKDTTREDYIKRGTCGLVTHSVVDLAGMWHEANQMGWWGITYDYNEDEDTWRNKFFERFLLPLSPNNKIVVVDCHI